MPRRSSWEDHSSYGEDRRREDCYDDDGNVIEDCMERLNAEERNTKAYGSSSREPDRKKEGYIAEDGTKFRTISERDNYNRYLHKEGQRHMREEGAKRKKQARLDPTDSGFGEHQFDPTRGKPAWRRDDDRYGGGATPYPKNKRPPTAPAGVAMRKKRAY